MRPGVGTTVCGGSCGVRNGVGRPHSNNTSRGRSSASGRDAMRVPLASSGLVPRRNSSIARFGVSGWLFASRLRLTYQLSPAEARVGSVRVGAVRGGAIRVGLLPLDTFHVEVDLVGRGTSETFTGWILLWISLLRWFDWFRLARSVGFASAFGNAGLPCRTQSSQVTCNSDSDANP